MSYRQNWVTVRWVGPEWLKKYDSKRRWSIFWRAERVDFNEKEPKHAVLQRIADMKHVDELYLNCIRSDQIDAELKEMLAKSIANVAYSDTKNPQFRLQQQ